MRWGSKGFPKEIDMLNNLKVVFTVSDHRRALSHYFSAGHTHMLHCKGMTYSYFLQEDCILSLFSLTLSFTPTVPVLICFSYSLSLYFLCSLHSLSPSSPSLYFCLPGLGEQGPEQREDLSDLSDSESGQDGPERDEQEMHSGSEAAVWCGRYLNRSQYLSPL